MFAVFNFKIKGKHTGKERAKHHFMKSHERTPYHSSKQRNGLLTSQTTALLEVSTAAWVIKQITSKVLCQTGIPQTGLLAMSKI